MLDVKPSPKIGLHSLFQKLESTCFSRDMYETIDISHTQRMKTNTDNMRTQFRDQTKLTSVYDRDHYLCFGHDVCGQLHHSKVPLSDRSLDLIVPDLHGRRTSIRCRYFGLFAATIHPNLTTGSNLYTASVGYRCHIPPCYKVGKMGGGDFDVNRPCHAHFRNPTTSFSHKILRIAVSKFRRVM